MISATQALVNAHKFRKQGLDPNKSATLGFINDCLNPRIEMVSLAGEFRTTLDVSFYDVHIRGFYEFLREQLIKSGFGYELTNYPEEVVITW